MDEITYEQVRQWILRNSDDQEAMDNINRLTYPFTSKYAVRSTKSEEGGD